MEGFLRASSEPGGDAGGDGNTMATEAKGDQSSVS